MKVEMVQGSDNYNSQMLYFTTPSLSDDEQYLYYLSDEAGAMNAYVKNLENGEIVQLSHNTDPKNYRDVYSIQGVIGKGWGNLALDAANSVLYYFNDCDLCRADVDGNITVVAKLPEDEFLSLPHISADGRYMCVGGNDPRALVDRDKVDVFEIDRRIHRDKLKSYIHVFDLQTGAEVKREQIPFGWLSHIQFSPVDNNIILYNHEHASFDCGTRRVWLWDGNTHRQLRTAGDGRSGDDWCCHEFWSADGRYVFWHGRLYHGPLPEERPAYVGRVDLQTGKISEILLDPAFSECYGHFSVNADGDLVSDGYWHDKPIPTQRPEGSPIYPSEWITVLKPDWDKCEAEIIPIGRHMSSWKSQDDHPHPIFNKRGDTVYFNCGMDGTRKIYRCKWR